MGIDQIKIESVGKQAPDSRSGCGGKQEWRCRHADLGDGNVSGMVDPDPFAHLEPGDFRIGGILTKAWMGEWKPGNRSQHLCFHFAGKQKML
ncbi:MAG: hypothetical protein ACKVQQ_20105 [Burkholderiales bacterium]